MGLILTRLASVALVFYLLLGQRLTVGASTGGRGTVSLPEVLFLGVAAILWLCLKLRLEGPSAKGLFLTTVGPLFTLLLVLPFVGVLIGDYELRALYSFVVVLVPLSILVLGAAGERWRYDIRGPVFVAVVAHGLYGLGQLLFRVGVMPVGLWSWAVDWDARTQAAYSELYVISSRSTGLFLNPNEFGLWSVLAVLFGALYLQKRRQAISVVLGLLGVFASQSRTAWLALALLVLVYLGSFVVRPRIANPGLVRIVLATPVVVVVALLGVFPKLVETGAVSRFTTGLGALTGGGASEDADLAGRYVGWARAREFVQDYALGTLGPPQLKFGGSIDSQFVSYYLQGGALLVVAYTLALISPFVVLRRRVPQASKLMVVSITFAIFSYTANPMDSPIASSLAWVCVILSVQPLLRQRPEEGHTPGPRSAGRRPGTPQHAHAAHGERSP